jgi:hypothetical protein
VEAVCRRNWHLILNRHPQLRQQNFFVAISSADCSAAAARKEQRVRNFLLTKAAWEPDALPLLNLPEQALDRLLDELSPASLGAGRFAWTSPDGWRRPEK